MDAIHTVILYMSVFASKAVGFSDSEIVNLFILSTTAAIFGSFFWGVITDIIGHKKTLILILFCWLIVLFSASFIHSKSMFLGIGALCGVTMGGVWVSARPLLISLSPKEKIGEFFGIYGLTGKCAAIAGPIVWGLVTKIFDSYGVIKYRIAVMVMSFFIIAGMIILRRVKTE